MIKKTALLTVILILAVLGINAQELQVKVNVNHSKIQGTGPGTAS